MVLGWRTSCEQNDNKTMFAILYKIMYLMLNHSQKNFILYGTYRDFK